MDITVVGSGYVGLVSGACFADIGHTVHCIDVDKCKVDLLNSGRIPIYEPGLEQIVRSGLNQKRLRFSTDLEAAVECSKVVFIAVGTPARRGDGYADLSYVRQAARQIASAINGFTVIVTKSTVPVGTGDEIQQIIETENPNASFVVVSNPEFLREGSAISDFREPDRIVVGTDVDVGRSVMEDVYLPLTSNGVPFFATKRRSAELIKYAANAFLAMKITFINEMAELCENLGINVGDVAQGIGLDQRIGPAFLQAGPGYGGSCFPKDTQALLKTAHGAESSLRLVETTILANERRKLAMADKIIRACGDNVDGKRIAILGLTFKSDTDDMRESPSLVIIPKLQAAGASIFAYDPFGAVQAAELLNGITFAADPYEAAHNADALVVLTDWNEFRHLDLRRLREVMTARVIVDLRSVFCAEEVSRAGFEYICVGRGDLAHLNSSRVENVLFPDPDGDPAVVDDVEVMSLVLN